MQPNWFWLPMVSETATEGGINMTKGGPSHAAWDGLKLVCGTTSPALYHSLPSPTLNNEIAGGFFSNSNRTCSSWRIKGFKTLKMFPHWIIFRHPSRNPLKRVCQLASSHCYTSFTTVTLWTSVNYSWLIRASEISSGLQITRQQLNIKTRNVTASPVSHAVHS